MKKQFTGSFRDLISAENLLAAWQEFLNGKKSRLDVQRFSLKLMDNILALQRDLANKIYTHGGYKAFSISDPKPRRIHKASVRDRLLHRALYRKLSSFFSKLFIADSYSCQLHKGTHRALYRFEKFSRRVSRNNARTGWVLKCDVRHFFANVDHAILKQILSLYIGDQDLRALLGQVIDSFHVQPGVGLPLGNLTSQLLVNIYLHGLDQFVKHHLGAHYYLRYCDDFVLLSHNRAWLESCIPKIKNFLADDLRLALHPNKISIQTLASGVDFLGWVHFPQHRILRTTTKRRMLRRIKTSPVTATVDSYRGLLKHGTAQKLAREVLKQYYLYQV